MNYVFTPYAVWYEAQKIVEATEESRSLLLKLVLELAITK